MSDGLPDDLPFIDAHEVVVDATRAATWTALERRTTSLVGNAAASRLPRLLGADSPGGFVVAERHEGARLVLRGRHRFSRYLLTFELGGPAGGPTTLRALSAAEFPGWRGRVYRALVIGTRFHVLATRQILRSVRRAARRSGD